MLFQLYILYQVRNSEVEEYDFDDFNSIASTTSMLNLATDIDDRLRISSPPNVTSTPLMTRSPPNGYISVLNTLDQTNGFGRIKENDKLSNFQKSLSRVQNWDQLGRGGEQEDWSQVLIQASEKGDLITVVGRIHSLCIILQSLKTFHCSVYSAKCSFPPGCHKGVFDQCQRCCW